MEVLVGQLGKVWPHKGQEQLFVVRSEVKLCELLEKLREK